jgi:Recombination endonuclease VII
MKTCRRRHTRDDLLTRCKECQKSRKTKYYVDNKAYFKAKDDERYAEKKDEIKSYNTEWNKAHPENLKNTHLKRTFGITLEDYKNMFASQSGLCAICEKPEVIVLKKTGKIKALSVDHCHKTGKIRSLLCSSCNLAIGSLKDDPILADKAAAYLRRHYSETIDE